VVQHTYKLHKQKKAENSSKHDRYRNNIDIITKSTKPELVSDKKRAVLEMNKSVKMPEKEAKITSIDDIVDKQVDRLKDVKGDLFGKQQQLI
jgi:hypothetical protein